MNLHFATQKILFLMLSFLALTCLAQSNATPDTSVKKDNSTMTHAKGTFEVKLVPLSPDGLPAGLGRMSIDKQFRGDLEGTSQGQMLNFGTGAKGSSGGYVALEQVTGTLNGRKGSFVLQKTATVN